MTSTEKVSKTLAAKFTAITTLTDAFCAKHLDEEYREVIQRVVGALARLRPSPLSGGRKNDRLPSPTSAYAGKWAR